MPLPWNNKSKSKSNRISRIVADLQPPSRAASLVVETGFPASVVDLFVKNRDRIKRHSLKKSKHHPKHNSSLPHSQSLPPPPPPPLNPNDSPPLPSDEAVAAVVAAAVHVQDEILENSDVELDVVNNETENHSSLILASKILLAVVPVLSSVKLALFIVFFAFVLEILGQIVTCVFILSSIQNQLPSTNNAHAELQIQPINSDEIQIVESNSDHDEFVLSESFRNREIEIGCSSDLGMEMEEVKLEMEKNKKSRSSKLRSKIIKKLIPKKLRNGKRLKKNKNKIKEEEEQEQVSESSCEEEQEEQEVWEVQQIYEPEEEEEGIGSSTMGKGEEQEQEQEEEKRKMNLESKIIIVMILLGLCGSRFLGLVLAISGCLISKFIKNLFQKWKFG